MAKLTTVEALRDASGNRVASVAQAFEILLCRFGPGLSLTGTGCLSSKTIVDFVLLVEVALEVHVGQGRHHGLALQSNQPNSNLLVSKGSLQFDIGGVGACLDVLLDSLLDIINVALFRGLYDLLPGNLGFDLLDVGAINLSRIRAFNRSMS
ncbi:hypothetical protein F4808DRAFT_192858 [Astrocystis sublimbata]|nr:hypothetical protein F4808DRAFT_192858 [Astrocystis sublimbata]